MFDAIFLRDTYMRKIIVHPGAAHFDDVLAAALILANHENEEFLIQRRQPDQAELDDPETYIIDIGGEYNPQKLNFDHHHDSSLPAAFVIAARHFGLEDLLKNEPWWEFKSDRDTMGPSRAAKKYEIKRLSHTSAPIEDFFIQKFSACVEIPSQDPIYQLLKEFGQSLVNKVKFIKEQTAYFKTCPLVKIKDKLAIISESKEKFGVQEFRKTMSVPADLLIYHDDRETAWAVFRFNDYDESIKLLNVKDYPQIRFVHANGFLAKTKERIPLEELYKILENAVS